MCEEAFLFFAERDGSIKDGGTQYRKKATPLSLSHCQLQSREGKHFTNFEDCHCGGSGSSGSSNNNIINNIVSYEQIKYWGVNLLHVFEKILKFVWR